MLAKLLSLLLHAKAGAISGVFLLGATGALVSVSTQNGVTTIVLTEPSASPTASASASPSAAASPTASASASPSGSARPSSSPSACADQAKALALQVKRVDGAFMTFHTDLMKLRETRDRATIETADKTLKLVRQSAVKAIHATATCKKHDDDEDESHETGAATTSLNNDKDNDEADDEDSDHDNTKPALLTFTGDAKSIADQAITAMQTAFDVAKNAPAKTAKPHETRKPEPTRGPKASRSPEHHD